MTRDELLEKMLTYLEEEIDVNGKTSLDFPYYKNIKNAIIENKDTINEKFLLMGDILTHHIGSAVRMAKTKNSDDCMIRINDNTITLLSYATTDKRYELNLTTYSVADYDQADVNIVQKIVRADKVDKKGLQETIPCDVTWISTWYDSKTGAEVNMSEMDVEKNETGYGMNINEMENILIYAGGIVPQTNPTFGYNTMQEVPKGNDKTIILSSADTKYPGVKWYTVTYKDKNDTKSYSTLEPRKSCQLWSQFFTKSEEELKEISDKLESMSVDEIEILIESLSQQSKNYETGDYGYTTSRLGLDELRKSGEAKLNSNFAR